MTQPSGPDLRNPMNLDGRAIIITGSGQGIGLAVARQVVALGGHPVIVDIDAEKVKTAVEDLGKGAIGFTGDVSDPDLAETVVAGTVARFGGVQGLVNNAGLVRAGMITKLDLASWQKVLDVHMTGSFLFLQAVAKQMKTQFEADAASSGSIVSISSDAGVQGTIGQINYSAAKAGLLGMTMSAARELARYNVRANSVAFGVVETPMTETVRGEKFRDTYLAKIPLARWSTPDEAAQPVCFLLSNAASYITGQRLSVNGGSQMCA